MRRLALSLLIMLSAWGWYEREALADFPGILSAYSAKQYCSCRFVMGLDETYCRAYVEQYLPLSLLQEDTAMRSVIAEGLGRRNEAAWAGSHQGCRLLP